MTLLERIIVTSVLTTFVFTKGNIQRAEAMVAAQ